MTVTLVQLGLIRNALLPFNGHTFSFHTTTFTSLRPILILYVVGTSVGWEGRGLKAKRGICSSYERLRSNAWQIKVIPKESWILSLFLTLVHPSPPLPNSCSRWWSLPVNSRGCCPAAASKEGKLLSTSTHNADTWFGWIVCCTRKEMAKSLPPIFGHLPDGGEEDAATTMVRHCNSH